MPMSRCQDCSNAFF